MRRARTKQLSTVYLRPRESVKDSEGVVTAFYSAPQEFKADIASNVGTVRAMTYGEKAQYMRTLTVWEDMPLTEGDGICILSNPDEDPDYRIVAIHYFTYFRTVDVEKKLVDVDYQPPWTQK